MKPTTLTTLAALLLIGAGGFMAGRISSSGSAADSAAPAETRSSRSSSSSSETTGGPAERSKRTERMAKSSAASSVDPLTRLTGILKNENRLDRNRALLALIDSLAPGDFQAVIDQFRSLGLTDTRRGELGLLLSAWASADPLAALAYSRETLKSDSATETILATWASNDPEGAIRWAETAHEGEGANPYLAGIIRALGATDPGRATQLLTGMPRSVERGTALEAMLPHLISQGNEATRAWIDSLTDDSLRNGAMLRSARELAATDPAGTAAWLIANPGEATQRRVDDVYSVWAGNDQPAALSSLASLPSGENRSNALRGIVTSVATKDPQAAVSIMDRFPNDITDRVVQNLIWHSFGNDPVTAVDQIARITDPAERERTYSRTLSYWMGQDATAANAWMQSNPLPQGVIDGINRRQRGN